MRIDKLKIYEEEFPHFLISRIFFPLITFLSNVSTLPWYFSHILQRVYSNVYNFQSSVLRKTLLLVKMKKNYMDTLFCRYVSRLQISISTSEMKECGNGISWIIFSRLKAPPFHEFLKENMALEVIKPRYASACKSSELFLRGLFGRGLISRSCKQIFAYLRVPRAFSKDVES